MVRTFQLTKALSRLTVMENMKLGASGQTGERFFRSLVRPLWRDQEKANEARAEGLLERFNLTHMRDEFAGSLSGGQRKLLEMARALMVEPELVMLDEPMAGVNPALAQTIVSHVQDLAAEGLSVVFVEHDMDVVRTISDWVVVMAEGQVIAEGRHSSIVTDERVIDAYLGRHHGTPLDADEQERQLAEAQAEIAAAGAGATRGGRMTANETADRTVLLEAREVVAGYVPEVNILNGTNLALHDGELVGIIGPTAPASPPSSRPCSASSPSARARSSTRART